MTMTPLTADQAAAVDTAHVVHGVDTEGAYLGLVAGHVANAVASGPPPADSWRWGSGAWQPPAPTLEDLRAERWELVKQWRAQALRGTFTSGGLVFDIDPVNITGAAVRAMRAQAAGETVSQVWVLANNSHTVLDAAGVLAAGEACAAAVNDIWVISITQRAQIAQAQSAEDLAAVVWPASPPP